MKINKIVLVALICAVCYGCDNTATTSNSPKELKVMAWNIWHGGHSKHLPSYGCEGTLGILKQSDADVILMVEIYGASAKVADHLGPNEKKGAPPPFSKMEYCYVCACVLEWPKSGRELTFIHLRPPSTTALPRCH